MPRGPYFEAGKYRARIVAQGFGESTEKKTPYFFLTIVPLAQVVGEEGQEYPAIAEYERTITRYLTDKTLDWVLDDLESLGFEGTKFADLDPDREGYHDFRGMEIFALCEHEENTDTDKTYERWSLFREMKSMVHAPLPATRLQKLDALFGREMKDRARMRATSNPPLATEPAGAEPPAAEPPAAEPPAGITPEEIAAESDKDDIPF